MGEERRVQEPAEDSASDAASTVEHPVSEIDTASIFSLSGGILRPRATTSNRIDGLLSKMLLNPDAGRYLADVDKNLDYLVTSLQLDMINISAEYPERAPDEPAAPCAGSTKLVAPFHDESRES